MNKISDIPNEFFTSKHSKASLQELVLNMNPLTELSGLIKNFKNLKVLGIGHTQIIELPPSIEQLNLEKIVVENTPLLVPKLVTAERGFQAIKDYFAEQREGKKAVEQHNAYLESEVNTSKVDTLMDREDDDFRKSSYPNQTRASDNQSSPDQLRFAEAIVNQMRSLESTGNLQLHEAKADSKFAKAYDRVIQQFIEEDKVQYLPDEVKIVHQNMQSASQKMMSTMSVTVSGTRELTQEYGNASQLDQILMQLKYFNLHIHKQLVDLKERLNIYKLKFVMAYLMSYLDEFITLCEDKFQNDSAKLTIGNLAEEFDEEVIQRRKQTYEIMIGDSIFYQKIGMHKELMEIFSLLGFRKEVDKRSKLLYLKIDKTVENMGLIKDYAQVFKMIQYIKT